MIVIPLEPKDEKLKPLINEFNRLTKEGYYPDILSWNHYDLYMKATQIESTPQDWKEFRMHPKIKEWYQEEQDLQLRATYSKILSDIGDGRSTGQAQTISAILNQINKQEKQENNTIIIYNFIPLTQQEKENPNINVLQNIPSEIRDSIQIIKPSFKPKEE